MCLQRSPRLGPRKKIYRIFGPKKKLGWILKYPWKVSYATAKVTTIKAVQTPVLFFFIMKEMAETFYELRRQPLDDIS